MNLNNPKLLSAQIINRAQEYGASLAGIVNIQDLKKSPSHAISGVMPGFDGVGTKKVEGKKQGEVQWLDKTRSAIVIAVAHPEEKPDYDWWIKGLKGGTKGNVRLISVFSKLADWLETEKQINCTKLPYHIENGAVFMKDSAVLGGLGCIGKNNMLITPQFGPRIRLRVMFMDVDLPSTGMSDFDPCTDCKEYCRKACPQKAFDKKIYSEEEFKHSEMPGRTGVYNRIPCNVQMEKDIKNGNVVEIEDGNISGYEVRYCRLCELACPVAKEVKPALDS
ncbi:MAG: epoxyqueuosine reductase [Desulfobacteraceae bacterium]|nr:epoxyqueuosine reductase [Desulfobacteraceae bacterium]